MRHHHREISEKKFSRTYFSDHFIELFGEQLLSMLLNVFKEWNHHVKSAQLSGRVLDSIS